MYYKAQVELNPSEITLIERVKPSHVFGKMLHFLTAGLSSPEEEQQTFTAITILQQLNRALRDAGVTNIVRLSKDQIDFYFDEEGKKNDLKAAVETFQYEVDHIEAEVFEDLKLVVEHETELLKLLIEIDVRRRHKVGAAPVTMVINGCMNDFRAKSGESVESFRSRIDGCFSDQESYDATLAKHRTAFDAFTNSLEQSLRKFIRVDELNIKKQNHMIRPRKKVKSRSDVIVNTPSHRTAGPVYSRYHGWDDAFFYAWLWSDLCYGHNVHTSNFMLVNDTGETILDVGEEGFDAGEVETLNPDADFEVPDGDDIEAVGSEATSSLTR